MRRHSSQPEPSGMTEYWPMPMVLSGSSAGRSGRSATIISPFWPFCSINSGAHSVEYHLECGMAAISISRKRGTSAMEAARVMYFIVQPNLSVYRCVSINAFLASSGTSLPPVAQTM